MAHSIGGCGGTTGPLAACEPKPKADKTVLTTPPMPLVTVAAGEVTCDVLVGCGTIATNVDAACMDGESVTAAMPMVSSAADLSMSDDVITVRAAVIDSDSERMTSLVKESSLRALRMFDVRSMSFCASAEYSG